MEASADHNTQQIPAAEDLSFTFVNATEVDICAIPVAIRGTDFRRDNVLEGILEPNNSYTLTDLEPMVLDLLALDCTGEVIDVSFETHFESAYTWEIAEIDITTDEPPEPPPTSPDQVWLVMLYVDADDEPLEQAIYFGLNEAELVGSSDQVHIVAQVDRFEGGFAGDGDWTTARRFHVTRDADLSTVTSEALMDLGEVNMADPNTLVDFVTWAVEAYPADKHVLILSDHGSGWPGGWTDHSASGDLLTLQDIEGALAKIHTETSLEQFELIGFDACLMSSLEVYTAIAPYARYSVASEALEPGIGWAYAGFLADLTSDPGMTGADLAQSIVRHYIDGDVAVVGTSEASIERFKAIMTLSAVDLAMVPDLLAALDALAVAASEIDQGNVALSRFYSQSYFSVFGSNVPPSYLDLGHLALMLAEEGRSNEVYRASRQLLAVLDQTVITEKHGPLRPGSTGISLYFPNSTLYGSHDMLPGSIAYTTLARRFASESLWDDYLLSHYTGVPMPALGAGSIAFAGENTTIVGPGVGHIELSPISASSEVFSMDNPVSLSIEVSGGHVAQVLLFRGLYVEEADAILVLGNSFIPADEDKEVHGVVYPDWISQTTDGVLSVAGDLWPEDLIVTDGTSQALALLVPEQYGGGGIYRVYGTHISTATNEQRSAMMRFNLDSAEMLNLYVLTNEGGIIAPQEYAPQLGDQFIVALAWIDQKTGEWFYTNGDVLTFEKEPFWLDPVPSVPGEYLLGATVVDLDGNAYRQVIWLTVEAD